MCLRDRRPRKTSEWVFEASHYASFWFKLRENNCETVPEVSRTCFYTECAVRNRTLSQKCTRDCTLRCPRKCPQKLRISVQNAPPGPHENSHESAHGKLTVHTNMYTKVFTCSIFTCSIFKCSASCSFETMLEDPSNIHWMCPQNAAGFP